MTKTLPITEARQKLPTLVNRTKRLMDQYIITVNGKPTSVLMSIDEFESWQETNAILADKGLMKAIKEGEKDVEKGRVYDWEDVKKELKIDV